MSMEVMRVGEVKDGLLEPLDLAFDLVIPEVRLKLREVVHSALAMGGGNNVVGVLPNVSGDLGPGSLDGGNRVGQSAVLKFGEESQT